MSERAVIPSKEIIKLQKQASDPKNSAWVEAHAGSGKTHVLIERVLRLLLSGTLPQNLVCLTYTKAAAAEMRKRVSSQLAKWAILPEKDLINALTNMVGQRPNEQLLLRARTLFAFALETPGGLKINTIHAFCESLLHRFSLEADVAIGFSVIEEQTQKKLINDAKDFVISKGITDNIIHVKKLLSLMNDSQIEKAVDEALNNRDRLDLVLADKEQAKQNLRKIMHHDGTKLCDLQKQVLKDCTLTKHSIKSTVKLLNGNAKNSRRFVDLLARINVDNLQIEPLISAFITGKGTIRAVLLPQKQREEYSDLQSLFENEAQRLFELNNKIKIAKIVERSEALIEVLGDIFAIYEQKKRQISALDYTDLIEKTHQLLSNSSSMDWVLYKLDANISHILIDESQDTNPRQWAVVSQLWDDFFTGKSSVEINRTIFGVGDKKQSIFSFQGARPQLFSQTGSKLKNLAKNANKNFIISELKTSFRTLENILLAIDKVFNSEQMDLALLSEGKKIEHKSARIDKGGMLTLWPLVQQQKNELDIEQWPLENQNIFVQSNDRIIAERIVNNIKGWIDNERQLEQRGRAIKADDVLILVQKRSTLFYEIIRALKLAGLETPGSDKIPLNSNIAVLDLLALADILLNPSDDLNLAAILRSPLFDIDEQALYEIAALRPKDSSLWSALKNCQQENGKAAFEKLSSWRNRLDFERPYEFFSQVLYKEGGLKRFHARLGLEIDDVIEQFLDLALAYENESQPSIQGFIAHMRKSSSFIKRELSESDKGVRIMSVHGAKGLESPIVILADGGLKSNFQPKSLYFISENDAPTLIYGANKDERVGIVENHYEQDKASDLSEYWRKLYVGMTRAEDELYITGTLNEKTKLEETWYGIVESALKDHSAKCEIIDSEELGLVFPAIRKKPAIIKQQEIAERPATDLEQTAIFDLDILPAPNICEIIRPSKAYQEESGVFAKSSEMLNEIDVDVARQKGIALHAILQHLGKIELQMRERIAKKALQILLPNRREWHEELANKAISILSNPKFQYLFAANSRAEVPFFVNAMKNGKPVNIAGRIDRIIIQEKQVLIIDFKSDANIASDISQLTKKYITQMALYALVGKKLFPKHKISTAIFWTGNETLLNLPDETLKQAIDDFTIDLSNISNY